MMTRCAEVRCSGLAKSILMAIADQFPPEAISDLPEFDWIAHRTCWSVDEVKAGLNELHRLGVLAAVTSEYGGWMLRPEVASDIERKPF